MQWVKLIGYCDVYFKIYFKVYRFTVVANPKLLIQTSTTMFHEIFGSKGKIQGGSVTNTAQKREKLDQTCNSMLNFARRFCLAKSYLKASITKKYRAVKVEKVKKKRDKAIFSKYLRKDSNTCIEIKTSKKIKYQPFYTCQGAMQFLLL